MIEEKPTERQTAHPRGARHLSGSRRIDRTAKGRGLPSVFLRASLYRIVFQNASGGKERGGICSLIL